VKPSLAKRVVRSGVIGLPAPPNQVFPLFTPTGEKLWVDGWDPEAVYPESGATEEGMVFKTGRPDGSHSVWAMTEHDPENLRVAYVRVTPGSDVCVVAVRCEPGPEGGTHAHVTYTLTALGERGREYLAEDFSEEHYQKRMETWEEAITSYLGQGVTTRW
jgi:hypothetical protein